MIGYQALVRSILVHGERRHDRTGVGTLARFGELLRFDLRRGFPAVTCKRLAFSQVAAELAAFLRGTETLAGFHDVGCRIWDANTAAPYWKDKTRVGRIYGVQWRRWRRPDGGEVDQLGDAVHTLSTNHTSRRIFVSAWNPGELDDMCLPPCHVSFQFYASNDGCLDCAVVMRSVDTFLGMPFDIASYALLTHIVGMQVRLQPRMLSMFFGDTHIYKNHVPQCETLLGRAPLPLPVLKLQYGTTVDNFLPGMAELVGYQHHGALPGEMNV